MVFKRRGGVQTCHTIELKDGHVFDIKKASAKRQSMHGFIEKNAKYIQYRFQGIFACSIKIADRRYGRASKAHHLSGSDDGT